jgi:hypothetical protein
MPYTPPPTTTQPSTPLIGGDIATYASALYVSNQGTLELYQAGRRTNVFPASQGTVQFQVSRSTLDIYSNGTLLASIPLSSSTPLYFKATLKTPTASIRGLSIAPAPAVPTQPRLTLRTSPNVKLVLSSVGVSLFKLETGVGAGFAVSSAPLSTNTIYCSATVINPLYQVILGLSTSATGDPASIVAGCSLGGPTETITLWPGFSNPNKVLPIDLPLRSKASDVMVITYDGSAFRWFLNSMLIHELLSVPAQPPFFLTIAFQEGPGAVKDVKFGTYALSLGPYAGYMLGGRQTYSSTRKQPRAVHVASSRGRSLKALPVRLRV